MRHLFRRLLKIVLSLIVILGAFYLLVLITAWL